MIEQCVFVLCLTLYIYLTLGNNCLLFAERIDEAPGKRDNDV